MEIKCYFVMFALKVQIGILASNSNEVNTVVKTSMFVDCKVKSFVF